jgi:hypothetical protein
LFTTSPAAPLSYVSFYRGRLNVAQRGGQGTMTQQQILSEALRLLARLVARKARRKLAKA